MEEAPPAVTSPLAPAHRSTAGRVAAIACWAFVGFLSAVEVARLVDWNGRVLTLAIANTGWLFLPVYAIVAFAALTGRRALTACAAVLAVLHVVAVAPLFGAEAIDPASRRAPQLRVVTANLSHENAEPDALLAELAAADADVVALQEVTPRLWGVIARTSLRDAYPYRAVRAAEGSGGIALLARAPLHGTNVVWLDRRAALLASVEVEGRSVTVLAVHPHSPLDGYSRYAAEMDDLDAFIERLPRPLVVAGDFNSTRFNRRFDHLLDGDLRDAHNARGKAFATSWPNGTRLALPLLIDHVLVSDEVEVLDVWEGDGAGSDHRPVIADLAILGRP
jgi:endonuclease/exonuclease/phosphatase (EEP) superfamily protein YafD